MQEEGAPFLRGPHLQAFIQRAYVCYLEPKASGLVSAGLP